MLRGKNVKPPSGRRENSDAEAELEAYDKLPRAIRDALKETPYEMSATSILRVYLRGMTERRIIQQIKMMSEEAIAHEEAKRDRLSVKLSSD